MIEKFAQHEVASILILATAAAIILCWLAAYWVKKSLEYEMNRHLMDLLHATAESAGSNQSAIVLLRADYDKLLQGQTALEKNTMKRFEDIEALCDGILDKMEKEAKQRLREVIETGLMPTRIGLGYFKTKEKKDGQKKGRKP